MEKRPMYENEHSIVLDTKSGPKNLVGPSGGVFLAILASSWALLGDPGLKLETSSQHVGTNVASDALR